MLTLALDTSTSVRSLAVQRDSEPIQSYFGDGSITHGQKLPGDVLKLLETIDATVAEVDRYVVAIGPGLFTGLRVGIATMQGFAIATEKLVIPISTLDATASAHRHGVKRGEQLLVLLDAHRSEIYANLYGTDGVQKIAAPVVGTPGDVFETLSETLSKERLFVVGSAAHLARGCLAEYCLGCRVTSPSDIPLAKVMLTMLADVRYTPVKPNNLSPLYIRKPDAVLVREARMIRNQT